MPALASFASQFPSSMGAAAASMAVFGFLFQVLPSLRRQDEYVLRRKAVIGGLAGLLVALAAIVFGATLS